MAIETIDFDLNEVVEGTAELLAEKAQGKGIELASWIHGDCSSSPARRSGRIRQSTNQPAWQRRKIHPTRRSSSRCFAAAGKRKVHASNSP
jgi:hypothetical protein